MLLLTFVAANVSEWKYLFSAVALLIYYIAAFIMCVKQIVVLRSLDYSNDIVSIQSSLVMLQTHAINNVRLAVACIPTFLAFPMVVSKAINDLGLHSLRFMDLAANYPGNWWVIQITIMLILTPLCIIFYREASYRNIRKDWVKRFIRTTAGRRITRAIELAHELEGLKKGDTNT